MVERNNARVIIFAYGDVTVSSAYRVLRGHDGAIGPTRRRLEEGTKCFHEIFLPTCRPGRTDDRVRRSQPCGLTFVPVRFRGMTKRIFFFLYLTF